MAGRGEHCREKQCFDTSQKILPASPGCSCIEGMDHASNMTPASSPSSISPAVCLVCCKSVSSRWLSRLADSSFRHSLSSKTCLFSAQQEQLHVSHPLSHPSGQSCLSKRSFETLSAVEAVAVTFQPHSLSATLQPLYLALRPLCSNWSSSFPQKQFRGLLSCAVVVTISSVDTSCYDFHTLVYFLSFIILLWYHECCHLRFLNSTEYLLYKNYPCLDAAAHFLLYFHFITFFNIFMHLC